MFHARSHISALRCLSLALGLLFAVLLWQCNKSVFYNLVSKYTGMPCFCLTMFQICMCNLNNGRLKIKCIMYSRLRQKCACGRKYRKTYCRQNDHLILRPSRKFLKLWLRLEFQISNSDRIL